MGWCCCIATKKGEVRGLDESTKCGHWRPLLASGHLPTQHWFLMSMTMIASLLFPLVKAASLANPKLFFCLNQTSIITVVPDERLALFFCGSDLLISSGRHWQIMSTWQIRRYLLVAFWRAVSNNLFHLGLFQPMTCRLAELLFNVCETLWDIENGWLLMWMCL